MGKPLIAGSAQPVYLIDPATRQIMQGSAMPVVIYDGNGVALSFDDSVLDSLIVDNPTLRVNADGNSQVGIGITPSYRLHVSDTDQQLLAIHRDTNTKSDTVDLLFQMDDLNNAVFTYNRIVSNNQTNSVGVERSNLEFYGYNNGSEFELASFTWAGAVFNPDGQNGLDFRVASDNHTHQFYLDSGNDAITIGSSTELAFFGIDGQADEVQFNVQAHSTQTNVLGQFTDSSNNLMFAIEGDGDIRTSRAATGTTGVGSVTASLEIFDAAGASLGHIAIYDSVS